MFGNLFGFIIIEVMNPALGRGDPIDLQICIIIFGFILISAFLLIALAPLIYLRSNAFKI